LLPWLRPVKQELFKKENTKKIRFVEKQSYKQII